MYKETLELLAKANEVLNSPQVKAGAFEVFISRDSLTDREFLTVLLKYSKVLAEGMMVATLSAILTDEQIDQMEQASTELQGIFPGLGEE